MNETYEVSFVWGTCPVCKQEFPLQDRKVVARHSGSEGFFGPYCAGSLLDPA